MAQLTAANLSVQSVGGISFAYRRFGNVDTGAPPLVFFQHFRGNLDNWDPAMVDPIAAEREVILFDNAGVGGSTGEIPSTFTAMAHDALGFLDALGLAEVDLLGFSIGGYVAQEVTLLRPWLVRRLVLAGTAPQGGERIHGFASEVFAHAVHDEPDADDLLALFFERSETSRARGREFVERIFTRTEDRDIATTPATRDAQLGAITAWGVPDPSRLNRLAGITQPVLVANGDNDRMVPTRNSHLLAEHLPDADLKIYPDAGHGFLFQYPDEFAADVNRFLARSIAHQPGPADIATTSADTRAHPAHWETGGLLAAVLDAHGGLDRWNDVGGLTVRQSLGGPFWAARGWPEIYRDTTLTLDAHREHITFRPFTAPHTISVFDVGPEGERVSITTDDGRVLEERIDPRPTFPTDFDPFTTPWDAVQVAYFASAACWNYLTEPFVFTYPGVRAVEVEPWHEEGETWRRLAVTFPTAIANHNPDQVFYYDDHLMLRRMDYSPDVTGSPAVAHYTHDPKTFDGFVFPTRRRVLLAGPDGVADQSFAPITVDVTDIAVTRR